VKFKLDENLGRRAREILAVVGHDVSTVADERIEAIAASELIERCQAEKRCLITLDLGFANPLTFLPSRYAGIAVSACRTNHPLSIFQTSCEPWQTP
jgi:predicted nuclease of predicted toxin-antitoxin system